MNGNMRSVSRLASVFVLLLALMGPLAAQTVSPAGPFGFLLTTSFTDPTNQGGAAILGIMRFDGTGKVSGPYTLEFGSGGPLPVTTITGAFSGTYSSNPGGTGTILINLDNGYALTLDMTIDDSSHGLQLIATSCSCTGGIDLSVSVFSGAGMHAKKLASGSASALNGSYGGQFTFSPQPSRSNTVFSFDGAGNTTMSITFVGTGPNIISAAYTGTYIVNANSTGTITLPAVPGQGQQTFVFVITNEGGPGLLLMQTNRLGDGVSFGTVRQ